MRGKVPLDPQTRVSRRQIALVYMPGRNRKRFSAACVEEQESEEEARAKASEKDNKYAAIVIGPSKSSEGQYIYYLEEWL